jgi:hypothetical protein
MSSDTARKALLEASSADQVLEILRAEEERIGD